MKRFKTRFAKSVISVLSGMMILLNLCACGGSADEALSTSYSQQDMSAAIEVVKEEFEKEWQGCTLNEIYYAGDKVSEKHQDWADRNNADDVLVLLSSFYVSESCEIGALNKGSTYQNFNWILVRTSNGKWQCVDWGY